MTPNWYSFGTVHLCKKVSARVARVFSLSLTILPISSFKASKQNFCKKKKKKGESVSADSVSTMYRTISVVRNIVKIDRDKKGWFVLCFAEQIRELSITVWSGHYLSRL